MGEESIWRGLNTEQKRAVEAVEGPVCILAGAGSGKTTTITRRIANQVLTGAFSPDSIIAVSFTTKAASEMTKRLQALGVAGVRTATFHAAALGQLRAFKPDTVGEVLPQKWPLLAPIHRTLPKPYCFTPLKDLAGEIEWAKNRRITPDRYLASLGDHEPPVPADVMHSVYRSYEKRKEKQGANDFEDLLGLAIEMFEQDPSVCSAFRSRFAAFTVDEYQDANELQQSLLDLWLGDRSDLCVVGDDYQSIYSFTGATPRYLLEMPHRWPDVVTVTLESNYRSTPEIIAFANKLVPRLGGARKVLRSTRGSGPPPTVRYFETLSEEVAEVVKGVRTRLDEGVSAEQIALLFRTHARTEPFEEALSKAGIPFLVGGGAFLERPAAKAMLRRLKRVRTSQVADEIRSAALEEGYRADTDGERLGQNEVTRQGDLARFIELAEDFDGLGTMNAFLEDLRSQFTSGGAGSGVMLLTLHAAKGLEFDAVFMPGVDEGELPYRRCGEQGLVEERRLLYVGLTRAKTYLFVSTSSKKPSRFLDELSERPAGQPPSTVVGSRPKTKLALPVEAGDLPLVEALKAWRLEVSKSEEVPAYVVLHDKTIHMIATTKPAALTDLLDIPGIGPKKCALYGHEILKVCSAA